MVMSLYFVFPFTVHAVLPASDTVQISVNGERVSDNSVVFVVAGGSSSQVCNKGSCSIGQQFYPVTLYKFASGTPKTLYQFTDSLSGRPNSSDLAAYEAWNISAQQQYVDYLESNAAYSLAYNPGPSEGGKGCGDVGDLCLGGTVGTDRTLAVDLVRDTPAQPASDGDTTSLLNTSIGTGAATPTRLSPTRMKILVSDPERTGTPTSSFSGTATTPAVRDSVTVLPSGTRKQPGLSGALLAIIVVGSTVLGVGAIAGAYVLIRSRRAHAEENDTPIAG
jgi:hypothetical protein